MEKRKLISLRGVLLRYLALCAVSCVLAAVLWFLGLLLFVGIPLPGTGAWTGSLIASLLEIDIKKSSLAIFCGIIMATVIMYVVSYGLVGSLVH